MIFSDLQTGNRIFLDANTLVYYFSADVALGPACRDLLLRVKNLEVEGFTSTHVIGEMAHRLMTIEAMRSQGFPPAGIAQRLRKNPAIVKSLALFRQAIQVVPKFGIDILTMPTDLYDLAADISQKTGLLTNDALVAAVMQRHGLTNLASNDADFDVVPGLIRYAPA